jgi:hypothetical protein
MDIKPPSQKEGTIEYWLKHVNKDWYRNSHGYNFPDVGSNGITARTIKHPDRTIEINIEGLGAYPLQFIKPVPKCDKRGLFVALTWQIGILNLYLNGEYVDYLEIQRIH